VFEQAFPAAPSLASSVLTCNDGCAVAQTVGTRHSGVQADRANIAMVARGRAGQHGEETLGYIAGLPGNGTHRGRQWDIGFTGRSVTHNPSQLNFARAFPLTPAILCDLYGGHGGDSCTARTDSWTPSGFRARVKETCDHDGPHTTERMSWLAFEPYMELFGEGGVAGGVTYPASGTHVSEVVDLGSRASFGSLTADATLNGQEVGLLVQVSDDGFDSVRQQVGITVRDGRQSYAETESLPAARYLRVQTTLRTDVATVTPALHGYSLTATVSGTIDLGGANLVNVGKINANLFDPVYRIDGELHATYLPENPEALVEVRGRGRLENGAARIELSRAPHGSPQWLFSLAAEDVHAVVTPLGPAALYLEDVSPEVVVVRSLAGRDDVEFFYHLTGVRVDMAQQTDTLYRGDPSEVTTAIDPLSGKVWRRGQP